MCCGWWDSFCWAVDATSADARIIAEVAPIAIAHRATTNHVQRQPHKKNDPRKRVV